MKGSAKGIAVLTLYVPLFWAIEKLLLIPGMFLHYPYNHTHEIIIAWVRNSLSIFLLLLLTTALGSYSLQSNAGSIKQKWIRCMVLAVGYLLILHLIGKGLNYIITQQMGMSYTICLNILSVGNAALLLAALALLQRDSGGLHLSRLGWGLFLGVTGLAILLSVVRPWIYALGLYKHVFYGKRLDTTQVFLVFERIRRFGVRHWTGFGWLLGLVCGRQKVIEKSDSQSTFNLFE